MPLVHPLPDQVERVPRSYRLLRALVRSWIGIFCPKVRVLQAEGVSSAGPTLLAVSHPPSFFAALLLVAALEKPVRSLLPTRLLVGRARRLLAKGLGMIPYDSRGESSGSVPDACRAVLERREAVAIFAELAESKGEDVGAVGRAVATLALQVGTRQSGRLGLVIVPVHLYLPQPLQGELLVYVDRPIHPHEYLGRQGRGALAAAIEKACQENAFGLQSQDVRQFFSDLEVILRAELQEAWASLPGWQQSVEGFEVSRFVADWVKRINYLQPAQLIELREAIDEYRERLRLWSLREFDIQAGGKWLSSPWGRACIWAESAVGVPFATYGLVNHLLAWLFLFWLGLLKKEGEPASRLEWLLRALVVLGCYSAQSLSCAYWLGRPVAALYAISLPLAGAYLWRYQGLLRHRTRRALLALFNPSRAAKLRKGRKELAERLNQALEGYARTLGVAY